jgi:hypothetical protein
MRNAECFTPKGFFVSKLLIFRVKFSRFQILIKEEKAYFCSPSVKTKRYSPLAQLVRASDC